MRAILIILLIILGLFPFVLIGISLTKTVINKSKIKRKNNKDKMPIHQRNKGE